jgi:fructose/tagatose bisphosphate aldolase
MPNLKPEPLAIDIVEKIKAVVNVPLVMHGASGVPDSEIKAVIAAGISKINADTDLRFEFRRGIEEVWSKGDAQLEVAMTKGREYMTAATIEKMKLFGSNNKVNVTAQNSINLIRHW